MICKLGCKAPVGRIGFRNNHHAARVFIEPVDNPGAQHTTDT